MVDRIVLALKHFPLLHKAKSFSILKVQYPVNIAYGRLNNSSRFLLRLLKIGLVGTSYLLASSAWAVTFEKGEWSGAFDSTFTLGSQWRVEPRDSDLIGQANGGTNGLDTVSGTGQLGDGSSNTDNGNLNYDTGLISTAFKGTHELSLTRRDWSFFVRGYYFYDQENYSEYRDRKAVPISDQTVVNPTRSATLKGLDQAISALISGGIVDTSRFPGSTLNSGSPFDLSDEADDEVSADFELLDALVAYGTEINETPVDVRFGRQVLNWGESTFIQNSISEINPVNLSALRLPGAELREAFLPVNMLWLGVGITPNVTLETFYQLNWEKTRVDEPGSYYGTNDFVGEGGELITISGLDECADTFSACLFPNSVTRADDEEPNDNGQFGFALRWYAEELNNTEFGLYAMNYHSRRPIISATAGDFDSATFVSTFSQAFAALTGAGVPAASAITPAIFAAENNSLDPGTGQYFLEYPEDIHLYGLSFNTDIKGLALSGEISFRPNAPIQIDDQELLQAALSSADPILGAIPGLGPFLGVIQQGPRSQYNSEFGDPGAGGYIRGYIEQDVTQVQFSGVKLFGPGLGANQISLIGEVGATHVNLPDPQDLFMEVAGTSDDGQDRGQTGFGEEFSWGYRVRTRLDFNNVIGSWNLINTYSLAHDVNGNTPAPISNFVEDRKSAEFGWVMDYQNEFQAGLSYATFWGGDQQNLISDRDFVALVFAYSL
ncbi:MAG: DUF1302 domain-containing protein [Pseudomonadota bacterium]